MTTPRHLSSAGNALIDTDIVYAYDHQSAALPIELQTGNGRNFGDPKLMLLSTSLCLSGVVITTFCWRYSSSVDYL